MSFLLREKGGVPFYVSTLLPCSHAFSTRAGGVSTLPHLKSMNIGENRGDEPSNPEKNMRLLTNAAGLPERVISAKQIHSANLLYIGDLPTEKPELDGFCTDRDDVTLCVKIADCLPILLCDTKSGNVAALHAGWRGSAAGIARRGVEALCSLGASPENILCAIGPGIGSCCFEVKEDFIEAFTAAAGEKNASPYILRRDGRYFADLKGFNRAALRAAGVPDDNIDVCPLCTCCNPDLFFSHRFTQGKRGTMGAMIARGN